ncbi:SRPBCC family protein [Halomicroarcula sp. GCM10025709]|uniref:SRPBCC family protein n=1 Tax=Halomicroarcula sp. GCM10025709 TaxID=3252669 RepID=UPI00361BDD89
MPGQENGKQSLDDHVRVPDWEESSYHRSDVGTPPPSTLASEQRATTEPVTLIRAGRPLPHGSRDDRRGPDRRTRRTGVRVHGRADEPGGGDAQPRRRRTHRAAGQRRQPRPVRLPDGRTDLRGEVRARRYEPPERIDYDLVGDLTGTITWTFEPEDGGTRLTYAASYDVPGPLPEWLLAPVIRWYNAREVRQLLVAVRERLEAS